MKFLTLLAAFFALYNPILNAQDFKFDGDTMTVVFESNLDKKELHSTVFAAIANIYNSANDVVQMNDSEQGRIIIKGENITTRVRNTVNKAIYPKNAPEPPAFLDISASHTLNIHIKDTKYRLKLEIGKLYPTDWSRPSFDYPTSGAVTIAKESYIKTLTNLKMAKKLETEESLAYLNSMEQNWRHYVDSFRQMSKNLALQINTAVINESQQNDNW